MDKKKILVVDDEVAIGDILRINLEKEGYAVAVATDGEEGIAAYLQFKPDVVTMDITMPNMNGIESLKEILRMDRKAKIVMISAAGQQKRIIEAIKLGAKRFITKPFEEEDVISCMDSLIKEM